MRISFFALLGATLFGVLGQAEARAGGPHPWPGAPAMFHKILHSSVNIPNGEYRIRNVATGQYMVFFSQGNDIRVTKNKNGGGSDLGAQGTVFRVARHHDSHYGHLLSIHRPNHSGNDKCISAGYSTIADTYALMYMCRVETSRGGSGGVTSPGSPIRYDKQLWVAIPGSRGSYKLIAVAHLYNYQPRCIYPRHISGYGAMKPHHYTGLALDQCILDNKKGKIFNWVFERA